MQEFVLLAPKGFEAALLPDAGDSALPRIDMRSLKGKQFVLMKPGHQLRLMQDHVFRGLNFQPNVILETDNWQTSIRLVESGITFTILPNADPGFSQQNFDKYAFEKVFNRHVYLCYRQNAYISKVMADFLATVRRLFRDDAH